MVDVLKKSLSAIAALAGASSLFAGSALAEDPPKFASSFNIGIASNYVFRGYSQSKQDPALQGGIDLTYGIAYFGLWASHINFGNEGDAVGGGSLSTRQVKTELDVYGGIKPVLGPATFDLGVILYSYPGANDNGLAALQVEDQNYVEFKVGVSGAFIPGLDKLTLGGTAYYSPEYQAKQGSVWTVEGSASYEFPAVGVVTPTVSALIGGQFGDSTGIDGFQKIGKFNLGNGSDSLAYWNVGITLAVEKLSFDFRYWGTDVSDKGGSTGNNFCKGVAVTGSYNQCGDQFAFIGKFTY